MKLNPLVFGLTLYDIVGMPGVAADVSYINTRAKVKGHIAEEKLGQALEGSDVVIPAGVLRKPGMTRDDLFHINASIIKSLCTAIAELTTNHPACQDVFAENNVVHLLVGHLAFETIQEHSKYSNIPSSKVMSMHSVVLATTNMIRMASSKSSKPTATATNSAVPHWKSHKSSRIRTKGRESEDPATKAEMKAMAAKAAKAL